jgi:hypothetical protein
VLDAVSQGASYHVLDVVGTIMGAATSSGNADAAVAATVTVLRPRPQNTVAFLEAWKNDRGR